MSRKVKKTREYPLKDIKRAIKDNNYIIRAPALRDAQRYFGWSTEDIEKAFLKLSKHDFDNSKTHDRYPNIWVDHYRAWGLNGEDIYTHFHFINGKLIIVSFKLI